MRRRDGAREPALSVKNHLRVLRAERGWSQAELADRLGVSRQTINAIETDRYDPSLPLAFGIARAFEKLIEEIFEPTDLHRLGDGSPAEKLSPMTALAVEQHGTATARVSLRSPSSCVPSQNGLLPESPQRQSAEPGSSGGYRPTTTGTRLARRIRCGIDRK